MQNTEAEKAALLHNGLVSVKEAMAYLRLSKSTVYKLMKEGTLAYVQVLPTKRGIPKAALVQYAANRLVTAGAPATPMAL